jgi:hypothetical protein
MKMVQKALASYLSCGLLFAPAAISAAQTDRPAGQPTPQVAKQTPEESQQLVAPIALYPDALVSQILAGATYPTEIVEADRRVQDHLKLKGKDLANAVDQQPWAVMRHDLKPFHLRDQWSGCRFTSPPHARLWELLHSDWDCRA